MSVAAWTADREDLSVSSDDGFLYRRLRLIPTGQATYTATLAAVAPRELPSSFDGEGLTYRVPEIWEERYGTSAERLPYGTPGSAETGSNVAQWPSL